MLNHLSWTSYFEGVMLLLVIYYAFVGIRFYATDIQRLLGRVAKSTTDQSLPDQLIYREEETPVDGLPEEVSYTYDNDPDDDIQEADELIASVKNCVTVASGKPYAPDRLLPEIRKIFGGHLSLKNSPHRPAINELVVAECERTGVAELTEDEVDAWWSG